MSPVYDSPTIRNSGVARCLPPYGREVEAALNAGRNLNVRLFACRYAWKRANEHRRTFGAGTALLLPPWQNPETFRWPRVPDLMGDITGLPNDLVPRLAHALVRDGCRLAYLLDTERPERNLRVIARAADRRGR